MLLEPDLSTHSHKEVKGEVSWTIESAGKKREVTVTVCVQPEKKLPSQKATEESFNASMDLHPFWHIQRSYIDGEPNCKLVDAKTCLVTSADFSELQSWGQMSLKAHKHTRLRFRTS